MKRHYLLLSGILLLASSSVAQMSLKSKGSDGWGYNDKYEQNFTKFGIKTYYGEIKSVDTTTPLPNMSSGIQLTVNIDNSDQIVHLGPAWFLLRQDNMHFSKGETVEILGPKVSIGGKQVIMASEVKKRDRKLYLRDKDGIPYWSAWRKE